MCTGIVVFAVQRASRSTESLLTEVIIGADVPVFAGRLLGDVQEEAFSRCGVASLQHGTGIFVVATEFNARAADSTLTGVHKTACIAVITRGSLGFVGIDAPLQGIT